MVSSGTLRLLESVLLQSNRVLGPGSGGRETAVLRQTKSNIVPYTTPWLNIAVFVVALKITVQREGERKTRKSAKYNNKQDFQQIFHQ